MDDKKFQSEDEIALIMSERALITPGHKRQSSEIPDEVIERWNRKKNEFLEWVANGDSMDVYQIASVLYQTTGLTDPEAWKAMLKVFVCATLQIFGMIYLCVYFMFQDDQDEVPAAYFKYCRMGKNSNSVFLKLLAMFFATWISLILADQIVAAAHFGLYSFGTQQPVFVNKPIIYLGLFTNLFVPLVCWISSMLLMYFSDNVIDLILNGLALYFIKEIDDEMVFGHDYARIQKWFEDQYDSFIKAYIEKCDSRENFFIKELESVWNKDCCGKEVIANPGRCWCLLSPLVIIAPVYLAICY
eukprot:121733_1